MALSVEMIGGGNGPGRGDTLSTMQIVINGEARDFPELAPGSTLADLIAALELKGDRIAVEQNGSLASRKDWQATPISDGDKLEVVHFVGGGADTRPTRWARRRPVEPRWPLAVALALLSPALSAANHSAALPPGPEPLPLPVVEPDSRPTFVISEIKPGAALKIVAYGDTRFTKVTNTYDASPRPRKWLVDRIAEQAPDAVFFSGDMPFHGSAPGDWAIYQQETEPWRNAHLRVYPTLGNHEFVPDPKAGLANYFANFPWLGERRWYSVQIGNVYLIAFDSFTTTAAGSPQRVWLEAQLNNLPPTADFVFFLSHMPLVTDIQTQMVVSLPGPEDIELRNYIESVGQRSHARFVVVNGHIHNYERFERGGVTYLVSGGGGAKPYPILVRGDQDLYRQPGFPNFHYLVFEIHGKHADVTMHRIADPTAETFKEEVKDTFTLDAK